MKTRLFVKSTTCMSIVRRFLLIAFIVVLSLEDYCESARVQLVRHHCEGRRTSNANDSSFKTNLDQLLRNMKEASLSNNKFYKGSVEYDLLSSGSNVYGLYFCIGNLDDKDCSDCIGSAEIDVKDRCSSFKQGVVWYDHCILRYSDTNFFGVMNTTGFGLKNHVPYRFDPSIPLKFVKSLVEKATKSTISMFDYGADEIHNRYGYVQCSDDLNVTTCQKCLSILLEKVEQEKDNEGDGWQYNVMSCRIRYESYDVLGYSVLGYDKASIKHSCSNNEFPIGERSILNEDLNNLLPSLRKIDLDDYEEGFNNTGYGTNGSIYGSILCRGDVKSAVACNQCLYTVSINILSDCANRTGGIVWHDKCLVQYSTENFFHKVDYGGLSSCSPENSAEEADLATLQLMTRLVEVAINQQPLMYAAGNLSINSTLSIYGQLQCTQDLSNGSCKDCLNFGLRNVSSACKSRKWWKYWSGSCILRYEDQPFFDSSASDLIVMLDSEGINLGYKSPSRIIIAVVVSIAAVFLIGFVVFCIILIRKRRNILGYKKSNSIDFFTSPNNNFQWMDITDLRLATDNFSDKNKIGEGGFGPVYKGTLDGNEIAIKRLSKASTCTQGSQEFRNEMNLILSFKHNNLVKLVGCCTDDDEKFIVYEYMPNGSLDNIIFDPNKRSLLDWKTFTNIIFGIARGLVYLHEDSPTKVIHRDMKSNNILLDHEMNPKISDFGISRLISNEETEVQTRKIIGTYGYLAPEFAMAGVFSTKSDVFSFGVVLLEIIAGIKNDKSYYERNGQSLLSYALNLWNEGRGSEFIDSTLTNNDLFPTNEIMRFLNIGLLCVQENPMDRPTMSTVLLRLDSEYKLLPQPKKAPPPPMFLHDGDTTVQSGDSTTVEATTTDHVICR